MTPTEFRDTLKRQGLTQVALAKLVYTHEQRVSCWANGVNKIPGGVVAFLELREGPTLTHAEIVALRRSSGPQSTVNLRFEEREPRLPSTRNTSTTPDRERTES